MDCGYFCCGFLLFLAASAIIPHADARLLTDYCGSEESYPVKVKSVDIDPNPAVSGKPATFKISATTEDSIAGGKLVIEVFLFGLDIHSETHDLCSKTACPVNAGTFTLINSQELPGFTPPGSYKVRMKMIGDDEKLLTCINIKLNIVWWGSMISEI